MSFCHESTRAAIAPWQSFSRLEPLTWEKPETFPSVYRSRQILLQNTHLGRVLSAPVWSKLTSLTIHTYALTSFGLISTLATDFLHLHHLFINLSHPTIHDSCLSYLYWETCPNLEAEGSTAWDIFAGTSSMCDGRMCPNQKSTMLRSLSLTRVAISSPQLLRWVAGSPGLQELKLSLVSGVDLDFVEGLAKLHPCPPLSPDLAAADSDASSVLEQPTRRTGLTRLELRSCSNLCLVRSEDLAWIELLVQQGLRWLSLGQCVNLRMLTHACHKQGWNRGRGLFIAELEAKEGTAGGLQTQASDAQEARDPRRDTTMIEVDPLC